MNVIEISQLRTQFGTTVIHDHLDLTVQKGDIMALVGGSGTGKTTLLRQMIGLETPAAGTVSVLGQAIFSAAGKATQATMNQLRSRWGMLFQSGALFSTLSVFDNVAVPLRELGGLPDALIAEVVNLKLLMVGLTVADGRKLPADLSGGMIKRVALARALVLEPELLLLDEPTAGLDPVLSEGFCDLILTLHQQLCLTVVMVTHDLDTIFKLSTTVAVLADKHVIACAAPADVLKVDHPFIQSFFLGERGRRAAGALLQGQHMELLSHGK